MTHQTVGNAKHKQSTVASDDFWNVGKPKVEIDKNQGKKDVFSDFFNENKNEPKKEKQSGDIYEFFFPKEEKV